MIDKWEREREKIEYVYNMYYIYVYIYCRYWDLHLNTSFSLSDCKLIYLFIHLLEKSPQHPSHRHVKLNMSMKFIIFFVTQVLTIIYLSKCTIYSVISKPIQFITRFFFICHIYIYITYIRLFKATLLIKTKHLKQPKSL